jgi:hypothetical protein
VHREAPTIGEHTAELLAEIGYSPEQVAALVSAAVVHLPPDRDGDHVPARPQGGGNG